MHGRVPCGTSCSWAPRRATRSRPSAVRAELAGNSAVRSGVVVKKMLTTSSGVSSLRVKSSFTSCAVLASISAFESSVHVVAPRSAWSLIGTIVTGRLAPGLVATGWVRRGRRGRLVELPHLHRREHTPCARRERSVVQRPDAGAHEPADRMADGIAHAPDLAIAALVDPELDRRTVAPSLHDGRRVRGRGRPVVELDSLAETPDARRARDRPPLRRGRS